MLTSQEIRRQFIDFFVRKHGHQFVASSPVVPHEDPTLLFANAGMNQFKPYFLGTVKPTATRVANTQKCIRAGGKHNDLEDVGKDTYHHTFFEMLGNWSFGDYFKKEAIAWAWELLVDTWGLDPSRLHATYFRGDAAEKLEPDIEARDLWLGLLPPDRVHPGSKKDNFWEMGDTGPCGPCSEIHIDRTPAPGSGEGARLVNAGDPRVMEIWNLVFIQFNRDASGILTPLPARHVDTGMGFERICAVIQSKSRNYDVAVGNYDTDVFTPIFNAIQEVTRARPYSSRLEDHVDTAYRVIADHIRCLTFALTDGAVPGNEGRGYVLRRILRRAVRHGRQTLGVHEPFFYRLVPAVVDAMGEAFPELRTNPARVADVIKDEEESFVRTIDRGIELFNEAAQTGGRAISAEDAFKLHDTYGFPLDLTQVMAEERGLAVDVAGFEKLMEEARAKARGTGGSGGASGGVHGQLVEIVQQNKLPPTEFLGHQTTSWSGRVPCWFFSLGELSALVTGKTPFYAEAGGQVGDWGTIACAKGRLRISDTQKVGDVYFHLGAFEGDFPDNREVDLVFTVDIARRAKIMANHTATHVMNHKLRGVLGDHVQQKGSLVDDEKLRFDFSHNAPISDEQVGQIEELVNADIKADVAVYADVAPQDKALKVHGLRAVFGEKYPPNVRVVSIGVKLEDLLKDPASKDWYGYSVEFCGGTHLPRTGAAERFVVVGEEAVGKGLRRITALTGVAAKESESRGQALLKRVEGLRGGWPPAAPAPAPRPDALAAGVAEVMEELSRAALPVTVRAGVRAALTDVQKLLKEFEKQKAKAAAGSAVDEARRIADENEDRLIIVAEIPGADADALRAAMDVIRKKHPEKALLLGGAPGEGKVAFVAAVPEALIKKGLKAGDWVKEAAKVAGGGGGGRPDMAQAGGKDPAKLGEALDAARHFAKSKA